jgi:hypothetical protein
VIKININHIYSIKPVSFHRFYKKREKNKNKIKKEVIPMIIDAMEKYFNVVLGDIPENWLITQK